MSLNLPDHIRLPTSPGKHNLAIAQIAVFGTIVPVHFCIRSMQTWRYWSHEKRQRSLAACLLRGFWNFVNIVAIIRIVGNALYLAVENPARATAVTIVVLQGVGVAPLVLSWAFLLLRCGRSSPQDRNQTLYPNAIKLALQWSRLPLVIAVVLIIVSAFTLILAIYKAGALIFLATFVYIACIAVFLMTPRVRHKLTDSGRKALFVAAAAIPLFVVRVTYLLLVEFGSVRFSPILGDWRFQAGMGFAMEIAIMVLLIVGRAIIQPLHPRKDFEGLPGMQENAPASEGVGSAV